MIESQAFMVATAVFSSIIVFAFKWVARAFASQKERDEQISHQLRGIERLLEERFVALSEHTHSIGRVVSQFPGPAMPNEADREVVRRELAFLAERMVKLERAAPLAVRCDPAEAGDGEVRCPYCHGGLGDVDLVRCSRCEAKQHRDCHESHGGCAVFGCGSRETRAVGTRVA